MMNRYDYLEQINTQLNVQPICAIIGPRQVGKATLARQFIEKRFPGDAYIFDLEDPRDLARLENPMLALEHIDETLIVIDEIQRRPDLFPTFRVLVDKPDYQHKFLILGSASRDLIRQSSETLAGRIGYIELPPFSLQEASESQKLWFRGGFPRSYLAYNDEESYIWRKNYIMTFLERDIPNLGFAIPPQQLHRCWMMLAHYHGQVFNASEIGRSLGISDVTTKRYLDILAGTFMVRILPPWFENIGKRQIKSPKVYFRDSGILHALLGFEQKDQLLRHPKLGALWEGFALEEVLRVLELVSGEYYFWATHAHAELDLLVIKKGKRIGFEFKYTDSPRTTKSMRIAWKDLQLDHIAVIVPGKHHFLLDEHIAVYGLDLISTGEFVKKLPL